MAAHSLLRFAAAALAAAAVAGTSPAELEPEPVVPALATDDQCDARGSECALNALQRRASTRGQAAADSSAALGASDPAEGSCRAYGCAGFVQARACQCNDDCEAAGNCCSDFSAVCKRADAAAGGCYHSGNTYSLDWKAQGDTFFDNFTFVTVDEVHGAQQYVQREEAKQHGAISTNNGTAQLKVGEIRPPSYDGEASKRYSPNIHTNHAWDPKQGILFVMSYNHVPLGCGVWPSFWAMHSNAVWPAGGELDMLEYANFEKSKASFHIAGGCKLDQKKTEACKPHGAVHEKKDLWDCETSYFENKPGCIPPQLRANGQDWNQRPGVVAAEWTDRMVTVYRIPRDQVPADLAADRPRPAEWAKWAVAYFDFEPGCNPGPQELILNIQLCGDWAGASWESGGGSCGTKTGFSTKSGRCVKGLSQPKDCCTQYVTSEKGGAMLAESGFFDINYLKVFTANGHSGTPSGTYMRGGRPLK